MSIFESLENLNVSEECFDDIMDIVEEIISEVSMKKWTETAAAVQPIRKAKAEHSKLKTDALQQAYNSTGDKSKHKDNIKNAMLDAEDERNADYSRAVHASEVSKLKKGTGNAPANRVVKAANKVAAKRDDELGSANKRASHAVSITAEDPVVSRTKPYRAVLPPVKEK